MIEVEWGGGYPDEMPRLSLNSFYNKNMSEKSKKAIVEALKKEAEVLLGSPMTYSLIQYAQDNAQDLLALMPSDKVSFEGLDSLYIQPCRARLWRERRERGRRRGGGGDRGGGCGKGRGRRKREEKREKGGADQESQEKNGRQNECSRRETKRMGLGRRCEGAEQNGFSAVLNLSTAANVSSSLCHCVSKRSLISHQQ
ncbi:RWD domain-containing protein 4 [Geodia barretti]|nr:RWD domain-containing protein 4 [Geodia barretti]